MAQATGSRINLGYVKEVTPGTTPLTPAFKALPITGHTLQLSRGLISDNSLRSDRMKRFSRLGNRTAGGSISVNYAPNTYADLLEAVMFSATSVTAGAKVGTTQSFFTVEHGQPDIGVYRQFTGMCPSSFTLNVPSGNSLVTAEFEFLGMNGEIASSTLDANFDEPSNADEPFVHLDSTFSEGGTGIAYLTGVQVKIDNALSANFALGSDGARSITAGMANVTGQITAFYESGELAQKFLNETESSLQFTLSSNGTTETWSLPRVQYNSAGVAVSGDGPQVITLTFEALYDQATDTVLSVTAS